MSRWRWILLGAVIVVFAGVKIHNDFYSPKAVVRLGGREFKVLVADTPARMFRGWSDRLSMGKYGGMLFVFGEDGRHAMVMRDMYFPLDIVWLKDGEVLDIAPDVPPERGVPEARLTPYFSRLPSDTVLELPAGFAAETGLKIGDKMEIKPQP